MKVEVTGAPLDLADELLEEFHATAKAAVSAGADLLLTEVKRQLSLREGPAHAPAGEPPAMQTHELVNSWKRTPVRVKGRVVSAGIKSSHPGIGRLEYGAVDRRGIHTLPHPFLGPSLEAVQSAVTRLLNESVVKK